MLYKSLSDSYSKIMVLCSTPAYNNLLGKPDCSQQDIAGLSFSGIDLVKKIVSSNVAGIPDKTITDKINALPHGTVLTQQPVSKTIEAESSKRPAW